MGHRQNRNSMIEAIFNFIYLQIDTQLDCMIEIASYLKVQTFNDKETIAKDLNAQ